MKEEEEGEPLTQHVATAVLVSTLVGNVGLDTKVNKSQVLDRVVGRVDAADEAKATAFVDLRAELVELGTKLREGKGVTRDMLAVKPET